MERGVHQAKHSPRGGARDTSGPCPLQAPMDAGPPGSESHGKHVESNREGGQTWPCLPPAILLCGLPASLPPAQHAVLSTSSSNQGPALPRRLNAAVNDVIKILAGPKLGARPSAAVDPTLIPARVATVSLSPETQILRCKVVG